MRDSWVRRLRNDLFQPVHVKYIMYTTALKTRLDKAIRAAQEEHKSQQGSSLVAVTEPLDEDVARGSESQQADAEDTETSDDADAMDDEPDLEDEPVEASAQGSSPHETVEDVMKEMRKLVEEREKLVTFTSFMKAIGQH